MVPRTVKFTSRNGIKTHPEMEKERGGGKSTNIGSSSSKLEVSSLLYKHPWGFAQGMAWKWDTPTSATQSPGSPVPPEQGLQARDQLLLSSTSACKEITADSSFHLFSTWCSLRQNQSAAHLTWAGLLSRSLHQATEIPRDSLQGDEPHPWYIKVSRQQYQE